MLRAEHLTLRFGATNVLRDLSAAFERGRITFVRGPSGAGKTSLLRVLAGLERAASGTVTYGDSEWQSPAAWVQPWKRAIGFVPQDLALWPHLTVLEHVTWPLSMRAGGSRASRRERARTLLASLEMDSLAARRPAELSGGEQQRVAIARAMAREPDVLLLDEPTAHLDSTLAQRVHSEILTLTRRCAVVTIYIQHDLQPEEGYAADTLYLERGEVSACIQVACRES